MMTDMGFDTAEAALLLVDIQPDFVTGGALAVPGGGQILEPVADLMRSGEFGLQVASQDWHPRDHVSFASQHEGAAPMEPIERHGHEQMLWPDHCIRGTPGAALHPDLPWASVEAVIRKGTDRAADSYSAFRNNWNADGRRPSTGLTGYLRERGVGTVVLCGLARDYCVRWSAQDAAEEGFDTWLLWDLTRSVDTSGDGALRRDLEASGVHVVEGLP